MGEFADRVLAERIRQIYLDTEEIYGAPRIYSELRLADGIRVGKKRVARLMRQLGLRGADGKRGGPRTTIRDPKRLSAPDLVDRDFARAEPNRLWVCDLKYIQTGQGFLFLAVVQDVFSRRIIGWSMRDDLRSELVLDALGMAVSARGSAAAGVIAHSDHGSQYTSLVYGAYAKQSGIDLSMGSIGDPWDNAVAESFFASLEKELLRRERFATREQSRLRVFWYIECFYTRAPGTPASACPARSTTNNNATTNNTTNRPSRPNPPLSREFGVTQVPRDGLSDAGAASTATRR